MQRQDMLREAVVQRLVRPVQQEEDQVEARQHRAAHLQVLAHSLRVRADPSDEPEHVLLVMPSGLGACCHLGTQSELSHCTLP